MDSRDRLLQKDEINYRNLNPLQIQHPCRLTSVGKTDSGKTYAIIKHILLDANVPFDRIVWCAPQASLEQAKIKALKKQLGSKLILVDGLNEEMLQDIVERKPYKEQMCIVLDDLIHSSGASKFVNNLFTSGRHKNISIVEILQRIYTGSKDARTHRLNSEYFMLHSFSDQSEIERLMRSLIRRGVDRADELMQAYNSSVSKNKERGFLLVDLKATPEHNYLRYRDNALDQAWCKPSNRQTGGGFNDFDQAISGISKGFNMVWAPFMK